MDHIITHHISYFEFFVRLMVAIFSGFFIGLERQWINRVAGVQTNVLVCSGACLFILGSYFVSYEGQSASRIAAQIVSGIGFLGAGMIFRDGFTAHGINTAATVWCAAAIGVLCGMGLIPYALIAVGFLLLANTLFRKLDHTISRSRKWTDLRLVKHYEIQVIAPKDNSKEVRSKVIACINVEDHNIFSVKTNFAKQDYVKITVSFTTHNLHYEVIQNVCDKIEEIHSDIIVDWSQIKN